MSPAHPSAQQLREALAATDERIAALQRQHDEVVAASQASNADDEHDPEGSTIAFERTQVDTLLRQARRAQEEQAAALQRLERGTYGACEGCGGPIGAGRLAARPDARLCITCAAGSRRR